MSKYKNPVCKGSYEWGSACGTCERCIELKPAESKKQSSFQLVESLGLKVKNYESEFKILGINLSLETYDFVRADDLQALLEKGQKVYGHVKVGKPNYWGPKENGQFNDTHEGLLIGIREIKKEAVKLQWHETVDDVRGAGPLYNGSLDVLRGKRVRVTVEEIESEPS